MPTKNEYTLWVLLRPSQDPQHFCSEGFLKLDKLLKFTNCASLILNLLPEFYERHMAFFAFLCQKWPYFTFPGYHGKGPIC